MEEEICVNCGEPIVRNIHSPEHMELCYPCLWAKNDAEGLNTPSEEPFTGCHYLPFECIWEMD